MTLYHQSKFYAKIIISQKFLKKQLELMDLQIIVRIDNRSHLPGRKIDEQLTRVPSI